MSGLWYALSCPACEWEVSGEGEPPTLRDYLPADVVAEWEALREAPQRAQAWLLEGAEEADEAREPARAEMLRHLARGIVDGMGRER